MEKLFKRFFLIHIPFSMILVSQASAQENTDEKISIQLENGESVSINVTPDVEDMKKTLGLSVSDEIRKKIESKGGVVENVDPMSGWKTLSHPDQQRFSDLRLNYVLNHESCTERRYKQSL